MTMDEVRVGMRLRDTSHRAITVTALTDRGFRYAYDGPQSWIPRWGWSFAADGHEHYGVDGICLFERIEPRTEPQP